MTVITKSEVVTKFSRLKKIQIAIEGKLLDGILTALAIAVCAFSFYVLMFY